MTPPQRLYQTSDSLVILPELQARKQVCIYIIVSSGSLAVKHSALGANGHRIEPCKRAKLLLEINFSAHNIVVADHVKWRCRLRWII